MDVGKEIDDLELEKGAAFDGHGGEAKAVAVLVPVGDLLGAGVFEVIRGAVWPAPGVVPGRT